MLRSPNSDGSDSKSAGITPSERHLARLCGRTFLRLWSYANPYRSPGKELCDVLAVCGNDIIIFSDKDCAVPSGTDNLDTAWRRWLDRAVFRSVRQLDGAERWLKEHSNRVFLDAQCNHSLPITLPDPTTMRIHKIAVAVGATEACKTFFGDNTGTLMRTSMPHQRSNDKTSVQTPLFMIGDVSPNSSFIHVFDDAFLDLLLNELDTICDLTEYLNDAAALMRSGTDITVTGQEELLALFKRNRANQRNDLTSVFGRFGLPEHPGMIMVDVGFWDDLIAHPQYIAMKKENKASYLWDAIIDDVAGHSLAGTLLPTASSPVKETEEVLRFMARERRLHRRLLSKCFLEKATSAPQSGPAFRSIRSQCTPGLTYTFAFLPQHLTLTDEGRQLRQHLVAGYSLALAERFRSNKIVIGIATESGADAGRSHDVCMVKIDTWTDALIAEARAFRAEWNVLNQEKMRPIRGVEKEFPHVPREPSIFRKPGRNDLCPCGSAKKFKRCCGRWS